MRVLKNVFFIWLIGLFLTGCAIKDFLKSDANFNFYNIDKNSTLSFKGENAYEDDKLLGEYYMIGRGERFLAIDKLGNSFSPSNLNKTSEYMKFYLFNNDIGSVLEFAHKNGVCSTYAAGDFVYYRHIANIYKSNNWLGCGGQISKTKFTVEALSSKELEENKLDDKGLAVEKFALYRYCVGMTKKAVMDFLEKNYCKTK